MTAPVAPYSPIVRAGDFLIVSGQMGLLHGKMVSGGVGPETRQALANMETLLESQGATLRDLVKTTVFLRHMRDFGLMNGAYAEVLGSVLPARSTVAVVELPLVALVEIEGWAYSPLG